MCSFPGHVPLPLLLLLWLTLFRMLWGRRAVLGSKPWPVHVLGKCSPTDLHLQSLLWFWFWFWDGISLCVAGWPGGTRILFKPHSVLASQACTTISSCPLCAVETVDGSRWCCSWSVTVTCWTGLSRAASWNYGGEYNFAVVVLSVKCQSQVPVRPGLWSNSSPGPCSCPWSCTACVISLSQSWLTSLPALLT